MVELESEGAERRSGMRRLASSISKTIGEERPGRGRGRSQVHATASGGSRGRQPCAPNRRAARHVRPIGLPLQRNQDIVRQTSWGVRGRSSLPRWPEKSRSVPPLAPESPGARTSDGALPAVRADSDGATLVFAYPFPIPAGFRSMGSGRWGGTSPPYGASRKRAGTESCETFRSRLSLVTFIP